MSHVTKKTAKKRQKNNLLRVHFNMPLGTKNMGKTKEQMIATAAKQEIRRYVV